MASQEQVRSLSFEAGVDLSAKQFHFVTLDANGNVVLPSAGAEAIGVLQNAPALGQMAEVAMLNMSGRLKVTAGAGLTVGQKIQAFGTGTAIVAASGDRELGTVAKAAASNELVEFLPGSRMLLP